LCCAARRDVRAASIWNSYNVAFAPISKTYALSGRSSLITEREHSRPAGIGLLQVQETAAGRAQRSGQMLDVILIALGLGFFALSVGYAFACDRL
jgi:hypothetical protein